MFRYGDTNKVSNPGEKQRKVVLEARKVTYLELHPKTGDLIKSSGLEIVKEVAVSPGFPNQDAVAIKIVDRKIVDNTIDENGNRRVKKPFKKYDD